MSRDADIPDKSRDTTPDRGATKATTEGRQRGDMSHPGFLTVAEAAQLLRVSARSIQRRCHVGTLGARLVETKFGQQWEVERSEVEKAATEPRHDPRQSRDKSGDRAATEPRHVAPLSHLQPEAIPAPNAQNSDRSADDLAARYVARLETENDFLRATVEQHQRSEAELRAALREALKAQPRQLTSGTPEAAPVAPEAARTPANRAEQLPGAVRDNGPQIALETPDTSAADFDEIAALIHKVFK